MSTCMIDSDQSGVMDIDETSIVEFPDGIIGFPGFHRFAMIAADEGGFYTWLQSVDEPSLSFLAVVPAPFFPDSRRPSATRTASPSHWSIPPTRSCSAS